MSITSGFTPHDGSVYCGLHNSSSINNNNNNNSNNDNNNNNKMEFIDQVQIRDNAIPHKKEKNNEWY
jgi:hypothetical protein